jgi:hypothetical protein
MPLEHDAPAEVARCDAGIGFADPLGEVLPRQRDVVLTAPFDPARCVPLECLLDNAWNSHHETPIGDLGAFEHHGVRAEKAL